MKFEYYNPSDESGSCVVRTMTKLTGKAYDIVKTELTALAKRLSCETYNVFGQYMADHDIYKIKECNNTTVGELNDGIYCIYSTNHNGFFHLIPVIDNVIYDRRNDSLQLYVIAIYKKKKI